MTEILIFVNIFIKQVKFYFYGTYNKSVEYKEKYMQVNNNTPSFTGFYTPAKHIDNVMDSFKTLSTKTLFKCERLIQRQTANPERILLESTGGWGYENIEGGFNANIRGKNYCNIDPFKLSSWSISHFFKKLCRIADRLNPRSKEQVPAKIIKIEDKLDWASMEHFRKQGLYTEEEQRGILLDNIKKILTSNLKGRNIHANEFKH